MELINIHDRKINLSPFQSPFQNKLYKKMLRMKELRMMIKTLNKRLNLFFLFPFIVIGCVSASEPSRSKYTINLEEQGFEYKLEMSRDNDLCNHMLNVYNIKFRYAWKSDPFYPSGLPESYNMSPSYSDNSKYSWPKLHDENGEILSIYDDVSSQEKRNYAMRLSKFPISKEFESIKWVDIGIGLYAGFDINNDKEIEQVVKVGFLGNPNKSYSSDAILIFAKGTLRLDKGDLKQALLKAANKRLANDVINEWRQIRPFVYKGNVYLHLQHDIAHVIPNSIHIPEKSYTIIAKYYAKNDIKSWVPSLHNKMKEDDTEFNNKVVAEGLIMEDTPGIKKMCRYYMKPIN